VVDETENDTKATSEDDLTKGLIRYVLGFLWRGAAPPQVSDEERQRIQTEHVANNRRMKKLGKVIASGPFLDDTNLRGILLFSTTSEEEIRQLTANDPAIKRGFLRLELHPWLGPSGLGGSTSPRPPVDASER